MTYTLMWKFSNLGEYKVHRAYEILLEDENPSVNATLRPQNVPMVVWNIIWRVRLPLKICNFIWKVIHDSLPTFQTLKGRGIPIAALCPFCECGCFVTSNNKKKINLNEGSSYTLA